MKLIKEKKIYTGNGVIENGYIRFDEKKSVIWRGSSRKKGILR